MKLDGLPATVNVQSAFEMKTALERILQALRAIEAAVNQMEQRIKELERAV